MTCAPKLITQAGCKDIDDAACICNQDFHFQISMMKCLYNTGCPNDLATFGFAVYSLGCEQLGSGVSLLFNGSDYPLIGFKDNSSTATPTQLTVPTSTPSTAATFSLPCRNFPLRAFEYTWLTHVCSMRYELYQQDYILELHGLTGPVVRLRFREQGRFNYLWHRNKMHLGWL